MKFLMLSIGLSEEEKNAIRLQNPEFDSYDEMVALRNIELLRSNGCSNRTIKNVVVSNSSFLKISTLDFSQLVSYLHKDLKIKDLNELFHRNPSILSKSKGDLENFILEQQALGNDLKKIKVMLRENSFTFNWK